MPWVRFTDVFPINRKVDGLSDAAFRLHVSAIFWCARNLTDGAVPEEDLDLVSARVRTPARFAADLVRRGLWHEAAYVCESQNCPAHVDNPGPVDNGWVIHDYLEFQPTKEKVEKEREGNAERQKRWRDQHKPKTEPRSKRNAVSNAVTDALVTGHPSRPEGTGTVQVNQSLSRNHVPPVDNPPDGRANQATRLLAERYHGLTDHEISQVITAVERRAKRPIKNPARYLERMTEGDLADIVKAVMDRADEPPDQPVLAAVPDWCGECDERTRLAGDPDRPHRCPDCHPGQRAEAS